MGRILLVEDEKDFSELLARQLSKKSFRVDKAYSGEEALRLLEKNSYDVVLLDIKLSDMNGLDLLKRSQGSGAKFIVITGYGDVATAVEAMKAGATDFIQKPFSFEILLVSIEKALREKRLEEENRTLKSILSDSDQEVVLESRSPKFREVLELIRNSAKTDMNILLRGETGTGKEVLARYIHKLSPRRENPFIVVDCSAIPEHLFESELFGHEKGAYTGATFRKLGLVELADGGTLFLDEIGEMPLSVQAKLLRFVETRNFRRVGGLREIKVNVRIIAATNRNLKDMVRKGSFRSDLLFRINTLEVEIPPLRERKEDIPLLAEAFLRRFGKKIGRRGLELLMRYDWPGNIRELRNVIERASLLSGHEEYIDNYICLPRREALVGKPTEIFGELPTLKDLELMYVKYLYERFGDVNRIASILGCSRRTVFRKLKELRERNMNPEGGSLSGLAENIY